MFAERLLLQQAIDQSLVSVRCGIIHERVHFLWSWRKAGEVQGHPADERATIRLGRGLQTFFFKTLRNKVVHAVPHPVLRDARQLWPPRLLVCPMLRIGSTFRNPAPEQGYFITG